jgi:hypothetical protein
VPGIDSLFFGLIHFKPRMTGTSPVKAVFLDGDAMQTGSHLALGSRAGRVGRQLISTVGVKM